MNRPIVIRFVLLLIAVPGRSEPSGARTACIEGDLLHCALVLARESKSDSINHALSRVAEEFAEAGRLDEALGVAGEIKDDFWRPPAEAAVVKLLARRGQHDEALKIAVASNGNAPLVRLGDLYMKSGDLTRAETIADKMDDQMTYARVSLLDDLALAYHEAGRREEASARLAQVEEIARSQKDRIPRSDFLLRVAKTNAKIGRPVRAVKIAMESLGEADDKHMTEVQRLMHQYYSHKVAVRAKVFYLLLELGRIEQALKLAREQPEFSNLHARGVTRSSLMEKLAKALVAQGRNKKARSLQKEVKPSSTCGSRHLQVIAAISYDRLGNEALALKLFEGMEANERMWSICDLAKGRIEAGKFESAARMAEKIEKPGFLASCLTGMAEKALDGKREDWATRFLARAIKEAGRDDLIGLRSYRLVQASKLLFRMGRVMHAFGLIDQAVIAIKHEREKYRKDRWEDILDTLADAGYCDLAVELTVGVTMSKTNIELALVNCARQKCFAAAVRLAARLPKLEDKAIALAKIAGLTGRDGWKPDPRTLEIIRKKILVTKK